MLKRFLLIAVAMGSALGLVQAQAALISTTDSIKSGVSQHFVVGGDKYLLRGNLTGTINTETAEYRAGLENAAGDNWNLRLRFANASNTFPAGNNPRCPQANPGCDTSGWLHFEEDGSRTSALTKTDGTARYRIDLGWGQFGYDAGGTLVTAMGDYAMGFWVKGWTYQTRAGAGSRWNTVSTGTGGDLNVYSPIPEPAALGLIGLGALLLARRRKQR